MSAGSTNNKTLKNEIETEELLREKGIELPATNNKTLKNEIETGTVLLVPKAFLATNNKTLKNEIET